MSKKKKGKKKKKKGKTEANEPKKPTEKDILNGEIQNLQLELNFVDSELEQQENKLQSLKKLLTHEEESKIACVEHLKRTLKTITDGCDNVQRKLKKNTDMEELNKNRADELGKNVEKKREISKSVFTQQKSELDGILSLWEEKRLKKNSQLPYLKKLDEDLREKLSIKASNDREEERTRCSYLLQKKNKFEHLVDDLCSKSEEVFQLSLPVYAKRKLHDNVRLRRFCEDIAEDILTVQDRSRQLMNKEESLKIEIEAQCFAENHMKSMEKVLKDKLEHLLIDAECLSENGIECDNCDNTEKENVIKNAKEELYHVEDDLAEASAILADQEDYKNILKQKLAKRIDQNGQMISSILRAGKIVRSRLEEGGRENGMDYELLKQIQNLFENYHTEKEAMVLSYME